MGEGPRDDDNTWPCCPHCHHPDPQDHDQPCACQHTPPQQDGTR